MVVQPQWCYIFQYYNVLTMRRFVPTGLSLPVEIAQRIEKDRGEISRSRYLLRIIEKFYETDRQGAAQ
jgi:hypothetical protein